LRNFKPFIYLISNSLIYFSISLGSMTVSCNWLASNKLATVLGRESLIILTNFCTSSRSPVVLSTPKAVKTVCGNLYGLAVDIVTVGQESAVDSSYFRVTKEATAVCGSIA